MHAALRFPARCLDASTSGVRTVAMSPAETLPRPLLNALGGLSMKRNVAERVNSDNTNVRAPGVCAVLDVLRPTPVATTPTTARTANRCAFMTTSLVQVARGDRTGRGWGRWCESWMPPRIADGGLRRSV